MFSDVSQVAVLIGIGVFTLFTGAMIIGAGLVVGLKVGQDIFGKIWFTQNTIKINSDLVLEITPDFKNKSMGAALRRTPLTVSIDNNIIPFPKHKKPPKQQHPSKPEGAL